MQLLPHASVRLLPGPFLDAQRTDLTYVLSLDPDRLLAPFLREAGLEPAAPSYGNWENSGLDGHIAGHYLSALALLWATTGEPETLRRLTHMVQDLGRAQAAVGTGYVGGVPGGRALFESLRDGGVAAAGALGSSDHWVPWYNLHKTFQGLIDAHQIGGVAAALDVVVGLADWWLDVAATIDDAAFEAMLATEFGGMNEAFAELARVTGRADYAAMARRFSHREILDPLLEQRDDLTGRHANTQIPKAVGYAATGTVTGDARLMGAADFFWRTVVERRTVAIGGNSVREHFHDAADFAPMIDDREGPETCNTVNMLRLTRHLAERELRPELLDFAERAIFNHLLSAQHPQRGGFVYFTSMRPRHYRVYSTPENGFWCCVGTGMEAQARYGEWVFGTEGDALAVNLAIPAELTDERFGGTVRLQTGFPLDDVVTLTFDLVDARRYPVRLRVPSWTDALHDLKVDDEPVSGTAAPGAVVIDREWQPGDVLTYRTPLALRAERLPDGSPWEAYLAGPVVLAARAGAEHLDGLYADDSRFGQVAHGRLRPVGDMPILAGGVDDIEETGPLRWRVRPVSGTEPVELEPFSGIHDSRYTVYWPVADGDVAAAQARLDELDGGVALDRRTIDRVQLGEQQPESDHHFRGTATEAFADGDRHWRTTRESFSVTLRDPDGEGNLLRVGVRLTPQPSALQLRLAGAVIASESFEPGDGVVELDFVVYGALAAAGNPADAELEVAAVDGLSTPGVTTVRLLRLAP